MRVNEDKVRAKYERIELLGKRELDRDGERIEAIPEAIADGINQELRDALEYIINIGVEEA